MRKQTVSTEGLKIASRLITEFFGQRPELAPCRRSFEKAVRMIRECFQNGNTLFICGSGGSYADALHISGEFLKSFARKRPLPDAHASALKKDPIGIEIADSLERGFPVIPLGMNSSLNTALWNDNSQPNLHFAQELYVLGNRSDILLAISTSGNSRSALYAAAVADILGIDVIGLTGPEGGLLAERADLPLKLPGDQTYKAQESHQAIYHLLCLAIEAAFFPEAK